VLSRYLSDWPTAEEQALGTPQLEVDGIFREAPATALFGNWPWLIIILILFFSGSQSCSFSGKRSSNRRVRSAQAP
jgi:hypothetical protein